MSREHPILFSGPMARAILEGRKSVTRRVVKPQPVVGDGGCWYPEPPRKTAHRARHYANDAHLRKGLARDFCPYGTPGDRLWVRETWGKLDMGSVCYRADDEPAVPADGRWRPSIHMPRWASRITLEVTEVRVQRLQEISEEDAKAEGVEAVPFCKAGRPDGMEHVEAFEGLWTDINGKRPGCSWDANPFVWVISFRRLP